MKLSFLKKKQEILEGVRLRQKGRQNYKTRESNDDINPFFNFPSFFFHYYPQ